MPLAARRGRCVQAHDPAVKRLPEELASLITLAETPTDAVAGADVAILATAWPDYRSLTPAVFVRTMRRSRLIDQARFLPSNFSEDPGIEYHALGARAGRDADSPGRSAVLAS